MVWQVQIRCIELAIYRTRTMTTLDEYVLMVCGFLFFLREGNSMITKRTQTFPSPLMGDKKPLKKIINSTI